MGVRLAGLAVADSQVADLISASVGHGGIQVAGDGQPIVLLAARQTVGGYPKIATVVGADLDGLGQRRPGDPVRFAAVDVPTARSLTLAYLASLGEYAVAIAPRPVQGWSPPGAMPPVAGDAEEGRATNPWNAAAVTRLVAALRDADVAYLRLEIAEVGLMLELRREPEGDILPPEDGSPGDAAPPAIRSA